MFEREQFGKPLVEEEVEAVVKVDRDDQQICRTRGVTISLRSGSEETLKFVPVRQSSSSDRRTPSCGESAAARASPSKRGSKATADRFAEQTFKRFLS